MASCAGNERSALNKENSCLTDWGLSPVFFDINKCNFFTSFFKLKYKGFSLLDYRHIEVKNNRHVTLMDKGTQQIIFLRSHNEY